MAAIVFLAMEDTVTIATGNLESNKFYQNYILDYLFFETFMLHIFITQHKTEDVCPCPHWIKVKLFTYGLSREDGA